MSRLNEYSRLRHVAVRRPGNAFVDRDKIDVEWQALRFHEAPDFDEANNEFDGFVQLLASRGAEISTLPAEASLTLDSIYPRDSTIIGPEGLIMCNMGRASRTPEAAINGQFYASNGHTIAGEIVAPGTLEGGDFIWIDEHHAAVGRGPRTNDEGIDQLRRLLGKSVELKVVQLPDPAHPDDVLHLMSVISPLDKDLALVYRPLIPDDFAQWLAGLGILLIEVPEEEYLPMGCNVLAIAPRQVIMLENLPGVKAQLTAAGCRVLIYKGVEISRKGEGGPTCLTRPLIRSD
jgi:N-dimethylarginine dimethylaminohydrolase